MDWGLQHVTPGQSHLPMGGLGRVGPNPNVALWAQVIKLLCDGRKQDPRLFAFWGLLFAVMPGTQIRDVGQMGEQPTRQTVLLNRVYPAFHLPG